MKEGASAMKNILQLLHLQHIMHDVLRQTLCYSKQKAMLQCAPKLYT